MIPNDGKTMAGDDDPTLELTAAELTAELAQSHPATLPASLAERIVAAGERDVARRARTEAPPTLTFAPRPSRRWHASAGWLVAAAAAAAWLLIPSPIRNEPRVPQPAGVTAATPAALRDSLLATPSAVRVAWAPSTDPAGLGATGEVLWDGTSQRGVLRFAGLAPNDPRVAQYQLWIVDAERDARYPVDGGVFDVATDREVIVRIAARLTVGRPTLFAITLERPGGVVVSSRERLVLAAPVES